MPSKIQHHRDWPVAHALLFFACVFAATMVPAWRVWPLLWLAPLLGYAALVAVVPKLRATFRPWDFGRVTRKAGVGAISLGGGAVAVLIAFDHWAQPDVGTYAGFLPVSALGGLVASGMIFSLLNALIEEIIFRGILYEAVESQWGARGGVLATALLFGFCHLEGYPSGPLGAVLAGVFGLGLGWLRVATGGLGLAYFAHVAADAAIFILVARTGILGH